METKLTLRLQKEIIERMKIYAMKHGISLSNLTESLYKNILVHDNKKMGQGLTPIATKYKGLLGKEEIDYEELKYELLVEKHVK